MMSRRGRPMGRRLPPAPAAAVRIQRRTRFRRAGTALHYSSSLRAFSFHHFQVRISFFQIPAFLRLEKPKKKKLGKTTRQQPVPGLPGFTGFLSSRSFHKGQLGLNMLLPINYDRALPILPSFIFLPPLRSSIGRCASWVECYRVFHQCYRV